MNSESAIELNSVGKSFPIYRSRKDRLSSLFFGQGRRRREVFNAVSDLSLSIKKGESVGLLGVNGAGKSTLLQMIAGTLTPSTGTVSVDGKISALLELGSGFNPAWTGRENATFQCRINGVPESEIAKRLAEIEAFADVGDFFDQPMRTYSSGMYMRVAFASAITVDPDILIVDEALAVGDARFQNKCYNRFFELQKAGKTILFVTHNADLVARVCTRGILIDHGKLLFDGTPKEAVNHYLALLYGSDETKSLTEDRVVEAVSDTDALRIDDVTSAAGPNVPAAPIFMPHDTTDRLAQRWFYNKNELRYGNGRAKIIDAEIQVNGQSVMGLLESSTRICVNIRVHTEENLNDMALGVVVKTTDNVRVYGTSTQMLSSQLFHLKPSAYHEFAIDIDVPLFSGDYFLDLGCSMYRDGDYVVFDSRQSSVHFYVSSPLTFNGLVDLNAKFTQRF